MWSSVRAVYVYYTRHSELAISGHWPISGKRLEYRECLRPKHFLLRLRIVPNQGFLRLWRERALAQICALTSLIVALRSRKAHSLYYLLLDIIANIITFILLLFVHYFIYHYCINDNILCNVLCFVYCMLCIIYLLLVLCFIIIIFWLFAQACVLIVCPAFLGRVQ